MESCIALKSRRSKPRLGVMYLSGEGTLPDEVLAGISCLLISENRKDTYLIQMLKISD